MRLPSITPVMDFPVSELLKTLVRLRNELNQVGSGTATEALLHYQRWSTTAADMLGWQFSVDDVDRIFLTRRHWVLQTLQVDGDAPAVHDMIRVERSLIDRALATAIGELTQVSNVWSQINGTFIVADTNVYLHNDKRWDEINWTALGGYNPGQEAHLLIPMVVVRELDRNKRTDRKAKVSDANKEDVRTRARVSTRSVREAFEKLDWVVPLSANGPHAELLLDPVGHRPLADPDAEIIDRALFAQRLLGRPVTLVTGDGYMQFQAGVAGLNVVNVYEAGH